MPAPMLIAEATAEDGRLATLRPWATSLASDDFALVAVRRLVARLRHCTRRSGCDSRAGRDGGARGSGNARERASPTSAVRTVLALFSALLSS
jgi:hypothetical protein